MKLDELEVYQLACSLSENVWQIYQRMDWRTKKVMGDQFLRATDSIGANIAEGYGRYHYLDRNKFNYNARGSLAEALHWLRLLRQRSVIGEKEHENLRYMFNKLSVKLNNYISSTSSQTSTH